MERIRQNVIVLNRVRCLECGTTYVKPAKGGTVSRNPGCPRCGYVGWILATVPSATSEPHRFAGDPRRNHAARSH